MQPLLQRFLFDRRDYALLQMVREVLGREATRKTFKDLLNPYLTPHGIVEMAASQSFRIAYAMTNLLHSLEIGEANDRIGALRSLHAEVLNITHSALRHNTARVLLQIMKELVRLQGYPARQLELAHDFRMATTGRPRLIRRRLREYHLLEMPEAWNQVAFDDHVHDANTKGRKTPTHLIMDAWIKGIRRLTVIYYNHVPAEAAAELLEAGTIMGIDIRIGVSLGAYFRGRTVRFIWVPRGFSDARDFLAFLAAPALQAFMDEGRQWSEHQRCCVLEVLDRFNVNHRPALNAELGIEMAPLERDDFLAFVGSGQASLLHLAEFLHARLLPLMEARLEDLRDRHRKAAAEERSSIEALVDRMRRLDSGMIVERFLRQPRNPDRPDPDASPEDEDGPSTLRRTPRELLERLDRLHAGYRICLNLSGLTPEEVLELIYDGRGMITHLEIFNLKDHVAGKTAHYQRIGALRRAINEGNVITLKRMIRDILQGIEADGAPDRSERIATFGEILRNIPLLQSHYRFVPLKVNIGSDSTGRLLHHYGMGLAFRDSLPPRAQKALRYAEGPTAFILPVRMTAHRRTTWVPNALGERLGTRWRRLLERIPGGKYLGLTPVSDWAVLDQATRLETPGNIIPLGGLHEEGENDLSLQAPSAERDTGVSWRYLNSGVKNTAKVLIGFIPAFMTFSLTQEWGVLAYGGAFIWFGITGLRNVLQSVLGGGGFRRSPLLRWNDYVSWGRLTDSLLFTGFSVPLLDTLVKTVLLDRTFGVTTATNPTLLYAVMALANGLYLASHNAFRGLPKGAVFGNLLRSVLSIPLAVLFNLLIGGLLAGAGVPGVAEVLQKWAAIISKGASDCVAGVIEGLADRYENIRLRVRDYALKLRQLFDAYARLELLFPEADVLAMLETPKELIRTVGAEARDLERILIINALDLLYLWMYQPRARSVLRAWVKGMSEEERRIFVGSQAVLQRQREISQLFLDGIIGRNFSRGLAFYLERYEGYLRSLEELAFPGALPATAMPGERIQRREDTKGGRP